MPSSELSGLISSWDSFLEAVRDFEVQHVSGKSRLVFAFVEGPLVRCLREGGWYVHLCHELLPLFRLTRPLMYIGFYLTR